MKEYLKIGNAFSNGVGFSPRHTNEQVKLGTHAINSHDELVAEVERLRQALYRIYSDGVNFIGAEDLEDEEDAAEIQGKFNDTLIFVSEILK
jgi:hypothetical protein